MSRKDNKVLLSCIKCGTKAKVHPDEERRGDVPICCGKAMKLTDTDVHIQIPDAQIGYGLLSGRKLD